MQSDAQLVKIVLAGSTADFATLVKRHQRAVHAAALDILGDYHWAQDAAQDAFVMAHQNLPALTRPAAFGPWLLKITRRCALKIARQRPRHLPLQVAAAGPAVNPNGRLDQKNQQLLAAVTRLPKAQRQVIMLRYFSHNSVKDVAAITGRSVGTVTKQLSRAHKRLRSRLKTLAEAES